MTDQGGNRIKDNSFWWSLFYLVLGSCYILLSDLWLLRTDADSGQRAISIGKGLAYVFATAVLLFLMMRQNSGSLRKLAKSLMDSDMRLRRIFDTAEEGLVVVDGDGKITDVNHRLCEILRMPSNLLIGTEFGERLSPASRDLLRSQITDSESGKRRVVDIELQAGDRAYWFQAACNDFYDADQQRYVLLLTDISDRVQREWDAASQTAELEQRVQERTAKLEALNRELTAFNYSVSHDLREPIRAISGLSAILQEDFSEHQPKEAQDLIERIRANAVRMNVMIDSLLKLSRLTNAPLKREAVSLTGIAEKAFEAAVAVESRHLVEFKVDEGMQAECDAALMHIALLNIIGNAWKYNSSKQGLKIEVGSKTVDGATAFYVRDNGIGFPPESAADIFKPFNRLSREVEGEGIGLATVQRIVSRHNGRVWAEGEPGKGACIWFTLGDEGLEA